MREGELVRYVIAPTPRSSSARCRTGEPVILTQHGRSAAVLLDLESYEALMDELTPLRDVRVAEKTRLRVLS
ncbi:MAG TPA: type II toxin-antitoxin system prevent-host-death family antitoxin [Gemmatimonadaceae bacterium]|nr:type II toxin-antitoxin system prevent-host-death family antitoxin [Gemmatimonadaceae bacterium]